MVALQQFLVIAKKGVCASAQHEEALPDGAKQRTFLDGPFVYRDRRYGGDLGQDHQLETRV